MSVHRVTKEELEGAMGVLLHAATQAQRFCEAFGRSISYEVVVGATGGMIVNIDVLSMLRVIPFGKPVLAVRKHGFSGCYVIEGTSPDLLSHLFANMSTVEDRMTKSISFEFGVDEPKERFTFKTGRRQMPMSVGVIRRSTSSFSEGIQNIKKKLLPLPEVPATESIFEMLSRMPSVSLIEEPPRAPLVITPVRNVGGLSRNRLQLAQEHSLAVA